MNRSIASLAASAFAVLLLAAGSAVAVPVTFVSDTGTDTGDCGSVIAACRQISFALTKTDSAGILHVLPGSYGVFTISAPIQIIADNGNATVRDVSGAAGITINGSANRVRLAGLTIDASNGVLVATAAPIRLAIEDFAIVCSGTGGTFGIDFRPISGGAASELLLADTSFLTTNLSPSAGAVMIRPSGAGGAKAVLDNVIVGGASPGIVVDGRNTSGSNKATIRDSVISDSSLFGLTAIDTGNGATDVSVEGSTLSNNDQQGIVANGANVTVRVRSSVITGNRVGIAVSNGGKIISHGDNVNAGNTAGQGAFTQTLAPQ